jgi:hypothetical protein
MVTRRQFVLAGTSLATGTLAAQACSSEGDRAAYDEAVRRIWHHTDRPSSNRSALMRELVRYATLAPSSHNTQCWKFIVQERGISILPDLSRRTPAVDPDDHHLFVSLGCAAENLVQAAKANGLQADVTVDGASSGVVTIGLEPTKAVASPLFAAIPMRQSTRSAFDGKPLSTEELRLLEQAATGNGVHVQLVTQRKMMEDILEYVVRGNTAQMNDPAFVDELKSWIRFSDAEAVRTGDGLFSRASGSPSVPRWLAGPLFPAFFRTGNENDKYARHVRSSAGIAVFVSDTDDASRRVEAGRCFERFALQATALGIRVAMVNQPVEVAALRPQFASSLGVTNSRVDLVVRFGRGPEMPRSLRRPLAAVFA